MGQEVTLLNGMPWFRETSKIGRERFNELKWCSMKKCVASLILISILIISAFSLVEEAVWLPSRKFLRNSNWQRYVHEAQVETSGVSSDELGFDLMDCKGLYIDIGTNIGNQIRKLYEPEKYVGAASIKTFSNVYRGIPLQSICSIGFEANPVHDEWLQKLEKNLRCHSFMVKIYNSTAVMHRDGYVPFYRDDQAPERFHEYGASVSNWQRHSNSHMVRALDIGLFMGRVLKHLGVLPGERTIPILMKLDAEGVEFQVLPRLINTGVYCSLTSLYMEWHYNMMANFSTASSEEVKKIIDDFIALDGCNVSLIPNDDESYLQDRPDLNSCV